MKITMTQLRTMVQEQIKQMNEKDDKCSRCGQKNSQYHDGWNDEDIESEVEEIF